MASDDQASSDQCPLDDAAEHAGPLPAPPTPHEELQRLLTTVLSALPPELLDRLVKSRVCFFAGDETGLHRQPICLEIAGRCFAAELFPSGFLYLNSSQLLDGRPLQDALFLVARKVAEILLWQERNSVQPTFYDFQQVAEQRVRDWGFERPHTTLLERLRNAMGLGGA
jgi:hypothetical protein